MYTIPKVHKDPTGSKCITDAGKCFVKPLSRPLAAMDIIL